MKLPVKMMKLIALMLVFGCAYAGMPGIRLDEADFTPRIIKGQDAEDGEFPYMVSLQRKAEKSHRCGGSILTRHWVLTAAHCCVGGDRNTFNIYTGSVFLNQGGVYREIDKIIIHEDYQPNSRWRNDICLIRVSSPFKFNDKVQQIILPQQNWPVNSGDQLTISGWGYTNPVEAHQVTPNKMQKATTIQALTNTKCGSETGTSMFPGYLCARGGVKGQGICNGDSGSPLVKNGVQVGISSWVFIPCGSGRPDFYARVPNYIDWIKETLGKEGNDLKFLQ